MLREFINPTVVDDPGGMLREFTNPTVVDDPGGVLREFINANELTGQVWVGLHQPSPNEPFRWV